MGLESALRRLWQSTRRLRRMRLSCWHAIKSDITTEELGMQKLFVAAILSVFALIQAPAFADEKKAEPAKTEAKKADDGKADAKKEEMKDEKKEEKKEAKKKPKKGGC